MSLPRLSLSTRHAAFSLLVLSSLAFGVQDFTPPPLTNPVMDTAGMFSPAVRELIDQRLRDLWESGGSQIAVLTVDNLGGIPVETAAIKVVEHWKLGTTKGDNGVLLFISRAEHDLRIEVGQGREGDLPDAYARRILDDVITPRFKTGDYDGGVVAGINAIMSRTDPKAALITENSNRPRPQSDDAGSPLGIGRIIFMIIVFVMIFGRRRRGIFFGGGGGWGGGGGFSGGDGFSGGGGGFSGGGASGKW